MAEPRRRCAGIRQLPHLVKPVQDETVGSYLERLATANRCAIEDLACYLAPTNWPHRDANARGSLIVDPHKYAHSAHIGGLQTFIELHALAGATGIPESSLAYALPELRNQYPHLRKSTLRGLTIAGRPNKVRPACRRCVAVKGITADVLVWMRHDQMVCLRHGLWIGTAVGGTAGQFDLAKAAEIAAAQQRHNMLIRRLRRNLVFAVFQRAVSFAEWHLPTKTRLQRYNQLPLYRWSVPGKISIHSPQWNAAFYPEAVALTDVLASPWRSRIVPHDAESLQRICEQIRALGFNDYAPGQGLDPVLQWPRLRHYQPKYKDLAGVGVLDRFRMDLRAREVEKPNRGA